VTALAYDGTYFQLVNPTGVYATQNGIQNSTYIYGGTAGGTANALTLSVTPTMTAYSGGQVILFEADSTNTGSVTINIDSVGAASITYDGFVLTAGEIKAGGLYMIVYNDSYTAFELVNPGARRARSCSVYLSSDPTIVASTPTKLSWGAQTHDYASYWAIGDPTKFVIPDDGVYSVTAQVAGYCASPAGVGLAVRIKVNDGYGTYGWAQNTFDADADPGTTLIPVNLASPDMLLSKDDYVEIEVYHEFVGSAFKIDATYTAASIHRV
jgi:hypothetical protein